MELQNGVVAVTGGGSGIGRAVAGAVAAKGLKRWVPAEGLEGSAVFIGSIPYARTRTEEPT
jgi:NAD(P)-dependent dehydrogenase (short-subunit alcohol dehydrogenase family)